MKKMLATLALIICTAAAFGQTSREEVYADLDKAGGVYYAYPVTSTSPTAPPNGYEPFHISHFGRHGSRYLISDNDYKNVSRMLHRADSVGVLTQLGKSVNARLDSLLVITDGMGGALSTLGVKQHRGIAERMYRDYPEVFEGETPVTARSTTVVRCVLSMDAFCERLKELNPSLQMSREASGRYMRYLNSHSEESKNFRNGSWKDGYAEFEREHVDGSRLASTLFSDPEYIKESIDTGELMWGLYWIAVGMQDIEAPGISFYDIFLPEELFDLWQCHNYNFYVCYSSYPGNGGIVAANMKPTLRDIIDKAEQAIASPTPQVALRFAHDGNLVPLAALLRLDGCANSETDPAKFYEAFADFKIAPMAGNIQLIFFRDKKSPDDVIVKFLLNEQEVGIPVETDIFPFYRWNDVKDFWETEILPG